MDQGDWGGGGAARPLVAPPSFCTLFAAPWCQDVSIRTKSWALEKQVGGKDFKNAIDALARVAQWVGALSHTPRGGRFDSQSGQHPVFRFDPQLRLVWEASDHYFSRQFFSKNQQNVTKCN